MLSQFVLTFLLSQFVLIFGYMIVRVNVYAKYVKSMEEYNHVVLKFILSPQYVCYFFADRLNKYKSSFEIVNIVITKAIELVCQ